MVLPIVEPATIPTHESMMRFRSLLFGQFAKLEFLKGDLGKCIILADNIVTLQNAYEVTDRVHYEVSQNLDMCHWELWNGVKEIHGSSIQDCHWFFWEHDNSAKTILHATMWCGQFSV